MVHLVRNPQKIASAALLLSCALGNFQEIRPANQDPAAKLPLVRTDLQVTHALELLPELLHGQAQGIQGHGDPRSLILNFVTRALSDKQRSFAFEIAHSVIVEGNHHGLDPFLLLAVMMHESRFNMKARGSAGEIGLMQIMPRTAQWLASQAGLPEQFDLENPSINIRIGATYLASLRKKFKSHRSRYLAAYNMGSRNVRRLLASEIEPTRYSDKVMNIYQKYYEQIGNRLASMPGMRTAAN